ncbi:MAG: flavodoxin family protein [Chloroflexi bacterium]|nr:flavodoxin family protein [Chloroflexota bacterium]
MKVVGFIGSPRAGGNTEHLVREILRGAREAGANTVEFVLNELAIRPCQGCDACKSVGRCRIQDDMQTLYDEILEADALVIGTPIYFWGPSAQTKAFLDRLYGIDVEGVREKLAGKRLLLACAFADADPHTADNTINMLRTGAEWFKMPFYEPVLAVASARGEVAGQPETMRRAYAAGRALASS